MKNEDPVVIEQDFNQSVADVWNAIVKINEMQKWYFENIPDFKAELGFCTQFMVESGGRNFLHLWEVTEVIPQKKVVYNWKYEGFTGDSFVSFEVSGNEVSAHLIVTFRVVENFPEGIPEFSRESCIGGWTYFIKDSLKNYLDG